MRAISKGVGRRRLGRPQGTFTQHRRLDRLRDVLEGQPAGVELTDLAAMLHVTTRSVRRYLAELERLTELESIEVTPGGAHLWRIKPSERGRAVPLRRAQAYGLLATRSIFEVLRGSALYDEMDNALRQVLMLAQRPVRSGAKSELTSESRLEERLLYLTRPPRNFVRRGEELDKLFLATAELYPLRFRYSAGKSDKSDKTVVINPYAMVIHSGTIHVIGLDLVLREVRTFVFDRMSDTTPDEERRFVLPADFDVKHYLQGEFGVGSSTKKHRVLIEFDARVASDVRERKVHPSQKIATAPDGRIRLSMTIGDLEPVKRWVLGFGDAAHVIEPPEFVEELALLLRNAAKRYDR